MYLLSEQERDKEKILTFAPTSCGVVVPISKTTDINQGKERKWLMEEVPLATSTFYVLDKDVYPVKELKGVFIGYKDAFSRLGGASFSVAFPGLNIYCVENTKSLSLEEYKSLALANKNFKVTTEKTVYFGEVQLIPVWLEGKMNDGQQIKEPAYLGVTKDKSKLLYIRSWAVSKDDPIKAQLEEDQDVMVRNLQYRDSGDSSVKGARYFQQQALVNENIKGAKESIERAASR